MSGNNKPVVFVTGNEKKFMIASEVCKQHGVTLVQKKIEIDEIQSDSSREVAKAKAKTAFAEIKSPVLVNDAGWSISGLNGFPGPYMKYINEWFDSRDFINLMKDKKNREVVLEDIIVFYDGTKFEFFTVEHKGKVIEQAEGEVGPPSDRVISLVNGKSIAKIAEEGEFSTTKNKNTVWDKFSEWYKESS